LTRTDQEVLKLAADAGERVEFRLSSHARKRMRERQVTVADVAFGLRTAARATYQPDADRWRLEGGTDVEGEELTLVIEIDPVLVVTLF
jgi:hypothetical protein